MSFKQTPSSNDQAWPSTISFSESKRAFNVDLGQTVPDLGTQFPFCLETTVLMERGQLYQDPALQPIVENLVRNAASAMGRPSATTCAELADLCGRTDARLLRITCAETCGCTSPTSNPWHKVEEEGCARGCLLEAQAKLGDVACEDVAANDTQWQAFWNHYTDAAIGYFGEGVTRTSVYPDVLAAVENFLQFGCSFMNTIPGEILTNSPWCEGREDLFRSLAPLCPVQCGCRDNPAATLPNGQPSYCPTSCSSNSTSR